MMTRKIPRIITRRLGTQMTAIVVMLFITTVVSLSLIGRASMESELLGATQRNSEQVLDQVIHNIEYYVSDMENIAQIAHNQPEILSLLFEDGVTEYSRSSYYHKSQAVQQLLRGISTMREELANIIIVGENGAMSDIRNNYYTKLDTNLSDTDWYKAAIAANGQSVYSSPHMQLYTLNRSAPVISIAKSISMYKGGKPMGAILIELNLEALKQICSTVTLNETGYVFIVDKDGNFIYHPNDLYVSRAWNDAAFIQGEFGDDEPAKKILDGDNSFTVGNGKNKRYIVGKQLEGTQWAVVGVVPYDEIFKPAQNVGNTQLAIGISAALAVAVIIAILLSRIIFSPINELRLVMERAENGDLDVGVPVTSDNEIGQLSRGFNIMVHRIKQLMTRAVEDEKAKRKAELEALNAQINPHFLYNTLDAIVWMSEFNPPEAAKMAASLAKLFRLALGKGSDIVTISQEMEYVEYYLSIQKMRYKSKFDYRVQFEPDVAEQHIPKLVVQVMVENAIYHGIKPKRKKCFLLVNAHKELDGVVVQVIDDGVGISAARITEILDKNYKSDGEGSGIGIKNVRERLRLYFGESPELEYYSIEGVGTIAEIYIPPISSGAAV